VADEPDHSYYVNASRLPTAERRLRAVRQSWLYFTTGSMTSEPEHTRAVAFTKSDAFAFAMFGTNVWGFRSTTGNQLDCTCTISRCPFRNTWS
jgi:hypothetical protein